LEVSARIALPSALGRPSRGYYGVESLPLASPAPRLPAVLHVPHRIPRRGVDPSHGVFVLIRRGETLGLAAGASHRPARRVDCGAPTPTRRARNVVRFDGDC
jgi:hypothetical protein